MNALQINPRLRSRTLMRNSGNEGGGEQLVNGRGATGTNRPPPPWRDRAAEIRQRVLRGGYNTEYVLDQVARRMLAAGVF
jgi:hypothetical protein